MCDCKIVKAAVGTALKLLNSEDEKHVSPSELPYRVLIGLLSYIAVCSRLDIAYAVR